LSHLVLQAVVVVITVVPLHTADAAGRHYLSMLTMHLAMCAIVLVRVVVVTILVDVCMYYRGQRERKWSQARVRAGGRRRRRARPSGGGHDTR